MRFFTISLTFLLLALSGVGCIQSIQGGAVLTRAPERMYVRNHTIDLRFVLSGREVEYGTATVTQVPGLTYPPTQAWQIRWGYARLNVPVGCTALDVRVSVGSLNIRPLTVPNKDGTYTIFLEEDVKKEGQK
ncbi:MAG: hypothetical protein Q8O51_01925 [bacterium]|nr:hypothetical protein [bacterium]